jgi:hypothetical protein
VLGLPGTAAAGSRLSQGLILIGFLGFQLMDTLTTHLGLALSHPELNRFMAPLMTLDGELTAYAVKGTAVAVLLGILMVMYRQKPGVWYAYQVAACLSAAAVVSNVIQLL